MVEQMTSAQVYRINPKEYAESVSSLEKLVILEARASRGVFTGVIISGFVWVIIIGFVILLLGR